jgi:hypothetical protein
MRCPKEGKRVRFVATPAAMGLYHSSSSYAPPPPKAGEEGTITSLPTGRGRSTCMPGPGGGLVYVDWDHAHTQGVFKHHLVDLKTGSTLKGAKSTKKKSRRKKR